MSAELEMALVSLYADAVELGSEQLAQLGPDIEGRVRELPPERALDLAAQEVPPDGSVDQFAAAQALVLGVQVQRDLPERMAPLDALAGSLLGSVGVEAIESASVGLVDVIAGLQAEPTVTEGTLDALRTALGSALVVAEGPAPGQPVLGGPAARLAAMLIELALSLVVPCRSREETIDVDGAPSKVTLVEIDVCTDLPFDHLKDRVDPRNWPRYNPYFVSVTPILGPTPSADGWSGVIQEKVGPGLNGSVYTTDLSVRCVDQPQLRAVAFDLADTRSPGDDGRVTVDRGFVSLTDEGARRRTRVLKVYRIADLDIAHHWVCPLWAWQVALSGWWAR